MKTSVKELDRMLHVNLRGAMMCSHYVLPTMFKQKHGCIVNVGSVVGSSGQAGVVAYSAAKSGLIGKVTLEPKPCVEVIVCFCQTVPRFHKVSCKGGWSPWHSSQHDRARIHHNSHDGRSSSRAPGCLMGSSQPCFVLWCRLASVTGRQRHPVDGTAKNGHT